MADWIKILEDKKQYIVNLERLDAFCFEPNKRVKLWLPESGQPIVVNGYSNPEAYRQLLEYINLTLNQASRACWIKINYERKDYLINLARIHAFSCDTGHRITFWLPNGVEPIVLSPKSDPEAYQAIQNYISRVTGYSIPEA